MLSNFLLLIVYLIIPTYSNKKLEYKVSGKLYCNKKPLLGTGFVLWKDNFYFVDNFVGRGLAATDGSFHINAISDFPRLHDIYFQIIDRCNVASLDCYNVRRGYLKTSNANKTSFGYEWNLGSIDMSSFETKIFQNFTIKIQCSNNNNN
uniref:ZP domain-containing protein n=1 Tax=Parastrongyloides trichosuri TaxID=131310 RepID=A0A0N4Z9V4_PARTI